MNAVQIRGQIRWFLVFLAAVLSAGGCNRAYYRRQADRDVYGLVREKGAHPHWSMENYTIRIDPRSRMFDPGTPDCPALPPDDPHAHQLMHCVDGKRGFPRWHDDGETDFVENPAWPQYVVFDENGAMQVDANDAVRLGLLHSRNYQLQLEELYLSALDVSFERFRFDAQFFGGYAVTYTADGPDRPGGGGNSQSVLNAQLFSKGPRPIAVTKMFTTGATLVVGLANQLVWQFSGPDNFSSNTLIDFSLVQPLLRNAGRDRVLERLTVAERTLLANVRAMEQYRQAFYVEVMTGRSAGDGPTRRGGVFGSGLEGFTGTGGGFGRITTVTNANQSASGGQGAGAAAVGGYLGILQSQQDIRNQEDNVERLRSNLFRLEQFLGELRTRTGEEGLVNNILRQDLQVAQARQALFNAESRLLNARNAYQVLVDSLTNTLGLPPTICMKVRDPMLTRFQLVDPLTQAEARSMEAVTQRFGEARQKIIDHIVTEQFIDPNDPTLTRVIRRLPRYEGLNEDLQGLRDLLDQIRELRDRLTENHIPRAHDDLKKFAAARDRRKEALVKLQQKVEEAKQESCPLLPVPSVNQEIFNVRRLETAVSDLEAKLNGLETKFDVAYERHIDDRQKRIDAVLNNRTANEEELFNLIYRDILYPRSTVGEAEAKISDIVVEIPGDLLALQLVQARARTESIELAQVDMRAEQAIAVAAKYRRDLMNARASLVDSWRLIRFNADQLESSLDLIFSGDISNFGDNPLNLQSSTGRLRVGFQFDAPLTRLSERNTYRQALIEYQQARRTFYAFEDAVARALRAELRTIATNQLNFELQRLAVLEAARQVDRNEDIRIDQELTNQASGATAARDTVSALTDLLEAQNNFMSIWVNYESQRRSLDLDLGTMQLDCEGLWIDPETIGPDYGSVDPWERAAAEQAALDAELPEGIENLEEVFPPANDREPNAAKIRPVAPLQLERPKTEPMNEPAIDPATQGEPDGPRPQIPPMPREVFPPMTRDFRPRLSVQPTGLSQPLNPLR